MANSAASASGAIFIFDRIPLVSVDVNGRHHRTIARRAKARRSV